MKSSRGIISGLVLLSAVGCRDLTGTRPLSVTGAWSWVVSDVDFFVYFDLKQQGTAVTGYRVYMYGSGVDSGAVVGGVKGRLVTLQWTDQFDNPPAHVTLNLALSADGQTMTGSESMNGARPTAVSPLERVVQSK